MKHITYLAGAVCALSLAMSVDAQSGVIPDLMSATNTANSSSSYPWNRRSSSIRVQYIYDVINFAGITNPIFINKIRFRPADATTASWTGGTYGDVTVKMSTAAVDYSAATGTFASNHGGDLTTVYSGAATVIPGTGNGSGTPSPWYVEITLTTPFAYDPTGTGDFVLDIATDGAQYTGGTTSTNAVTFGTTWPAIRIFNLADHTATTGTVQANVGLVMGFDYTPQAGLFAGFSATPTSGGQNLSVQFTDSSFSSAAGGVTSWAWDFGDGATSSAQNPSHTYTCGSFSPSLTVTDATHAPSTVTKTDYISAGLVSADFSASGTFGTAPYSVTFTDDSTGGPTSWAWDFGDGGTSTAQNPTHVYAIGGKFTVTLTISGGCNGDTITKTDLIEVCAAGGNSGSLATLAVGGNGLTAANSGCLFDLSVINTAGLNITSIDVNDRATTGDVTIDVYITNGTYVGKRLNREQWVKVSTGTGPNTGGGATTLTPIDCDDFYLAPGDYGVYVIFVTGGIHYTNGNGTNQVHQNCDLRFSGGVSMGTPFSGGQFSPRIFNGTFHYSANDTAASGRYAYGCAGVNTLAPDVGLSAAPVIGTTVDIEIRHMLNWPSGAGMLYLGATKTMDDLSVLGLPGCHLLTDSLVTIPFTNTFGSATLPAAIPNTPALVGVVTHMQAATEDPVNAGGYTVSNGNSIRVGN